MGQLMVRHYGSILRHYGSGATLWVDCDIMGLNTPPPILFERLLVCTIMVGDGEEVRGLRNTNCTSACSLKAHNEPR